MSAQDNIFNRLKAAPAFHPGSVELFDDITLEPGDIVTIRSGQTDQTLPIYNQHITWTGSAMTTLESTGNEKRSALPPLQKKQRNASFGGGRTAYKQEQQLSGYYQHMIESDGVLGMTAGVLGVVLDEDGNPVIDPQTGKFVYDDSSAAEIFGRLLVTANRTSLINAINQNGVQISGASLDLDASGNAIITAINDRRTGTAKINANRINISSTSGSGVEIDENGNITVTVNDLINNINTNATFTLNAARVNLTRDTVVTILNGTGTLTINASSVDLSGYVTADSIFSATATHKDVYTDDLTVDGNLYFESLYGSGTSVIETESLTAFSIFGDEIYYNDHDLGDSVIALQIVAPSSGSNTYTLQKKTVSNNSWTNVGTFSRATSLRGGWSGGTFTVYADPQGASYPTSLYSIESNGSVSRHPSLAKYLQVPLKVLYDDGEDGGETGFTTTISVNGSLVYEDGHTKGVTDGRADCAITDLSASALAANQLMENISITASGTYLTSRSETVTLTKTTYTVGSLTPHCVTLSLDGHVVGRISTESVYTDGIAVGEGKFSKAALTLRGSQISNAYHVVSTGGTVYYGTSTSEYVYDRGSYVVGRGTQSTLKKGGNSVYFKRHQSSETPTKTYYTIETSSNYDIEYYVASDGSFDYYPGNGSSGYLTTNGRYILPADTGTSIRIAAVTAYESGASYNTSNSPYYTKS